MKAILLAALCALLLLGCNQEPPPDMAPIAEGEVIYPGAGRLPLSPQQLNGCIEWLQTHRKDWGKVTVSSPFPTYNLVFSHSDGARTYVEIYAGKSGWDDTIQIRSFDKNRRLIFSGIDDFSDADIAHLTAHIPKPQ